MRLQALPQSRNVLVSVGGILSAEACANAIERAIDSLVDEFNLLARNLVEDLK
jgi:diacylglycerol kinase